MRVFITRDYRDGEEAGEIRAYATLESAQARLQSLWPNTRLRWREPYPGKWFARIGPTSDGNAVYIDSLQVRD